MPHTFPERAPSLEAEDFLSFLGLEPAVVDDGGYEAQRGAQPCDGGLRRATEFVNPLGYYLRYLNYFSLSEGEAKSVSKLRL